MGSANDFAKINSSEGVGDPWKLFTGDDLCYPVEMFVHVMEYKSGLEGSSDDNRMARDVLSHIPDFTEGSVNGPAAVWKQKILSRTPQHPDGPSLIKWTDIKPELIETFGCKAEYSLKEKLHLLQSLGKGPYEDSHAYLIRIRCVVGLLADNRICSSLDELPSPSQIWVRVLFLFGLDDMEQNLVIEESDAKTLDELCQVLAMPEVKMIRRVDDDMMMEEEEVEENDDEERPRRKRFKRWKRKGTRRQCDDDDDRHEAAVVKRERLHEGVYNAGCEEEDSSNLTNHLVPEVQIGCQDDDDDDDNDDDSSDGRKPLKKSAARRHWRCVFCDVPSFKTRVELWAHQDERHEGYKGKCDACDMTFLRVADLNTHNNQVHRQEMKSKKYKKFVSERIHAQLKEASVEESADKPLKIQGTMIIKGAKGKAVAYVCGICHQQLFSQLDMANHTRDVHNGRRYKCHLCDFKSKGRDEMGAHLLSIHDYEASEVKVFRCTYPDCRFKAISNSKVKDHIDALHLRLLQFSCEICGKQFRYKGALQSHQKDHHPDDAKKLKLPLKQKYQCEDCDQVFTAPCYLKLHREKKHRDGRPPDHLCPRCGRAFKLEIYLKRHLKEFHDRDGDKPCPYCPPSDKKPVKLYSRASLYQHIQGIHNRNLVCGLCQLAFSSLSLMIVHYRLTHLKYKQYRCKECNIKFSRTSNIRDHIMRKHFAGDFQPNFEFFRDNPIVEDYRLTDAANYPTKEHILTQIALDSERGHKFGLGIMQGEKYSVSPPPHLCHDVKYAAPPGSCHSIEEKYVPPHGLVHEDKYVPPPPGHSHHGGK